MSETDARAPVDAALWATSVAGTRGVVFEPAWGEHIAALVTPALAAFALIADELAADEDMYEFRRVLADEARRG